MGKRLTQIQRAIADLDVQIAKLQESRALLLKYAAPKAETPKRARKPKDETPEAPGDA